MKNLLNFIIKYSYALSFIFLELICFAFIFSGNNYHRSRFVNSSNRISGSIQEKWTVISEYTNLKTVNDSLISENVQLRNKLEKYRRDEIPSIDKSGYEYISAKVIGISVNKQNNFITINKGTQHGIENEMGVISSNGVVGIVVSTSSKYSTVLPIINPETRISAKIEKNNYFGSVSWDRESVRKAKLFEIPGYVNIESGDLIITSGFSSIFPEGIPIGSVSASIKDKSTDFYIIDLDLFTDFYNLSYVYVIKNNNSKEIKQLLSENND